MCIDDPMADPKYLLTAGCGVLSFVYNPTEGETFADPNRMSPCFKDAFDEEEVYFLSGASFANDAAVDGQSGNYWVVGEVLTDELEDALGLLISGGDSYFRILGASNNVVRTEKVGDVDGVEDKALAIAAGADRMVIVGSTGEDAYFAFYDFGGDPIKGGTVFGTQGTDTANGVAVDDLGNIYIAGSTTGGIEDGTGTFIEEVFYLASFDSEGQCRFKKQFFGPDDDVFGGVNPNKRAAVKVRNGVVYVCGQNTAPNGNSGSFLASFSAADGELIDPTPGNDSYTGFVNIEIIMEGLGINVSNPGVRMYDLDIDPVGRLVIYGDAWTNLEGDDNDGWKPYLLRFDPSLNIDPTTLSGAELVKEFLPSDYDPSQHAGMTVDASTGRALAIHACGDYFLTGGLSLSDGIDGPLSLARGDAFTMRFRAPDPGVILGDMNGDGVVTLLDVAPFIDALEDGVYVPEADVNCDGIVNLLDVEPFIELLQF
jgi:hypothetical protein